MANPTPDQATITQRGAQLRDDNGNPVGFNYNNITTKTTTTVKTGAGILHTIVVNAVGTTDTLTIYDNTAGSGTTIGTLSVQTSAVTYVFDLGFTTGLTIVSGGGAAGNYTVTYI